MPAQNHPGKCPAFLENLLSTMVKSHPVIHDKLIYKTLPNRNGFDTEGAFEKLLMFLLTGHQSGMDSKMEGILQ
jgi:hypothetical protein